MGRQSFLGLALFAAAIGLVVMAARSGQDNTTDTAWDQAGNENGEAAKATGSAVSATASDAKDSLNQMGQDAKQSAATAADHTKDAAQTAAERISATAASLSGQAQESADSAASTASSTAGSAASGASQAAQAPADSYASTQDIIQRAEREAYQEYVEGRLKELDQEARQFQARITTAGPDAQLALKSQIDQLQQKLSNAQQQLNQLKSAANTDWQGTKSGMEAAMNELEITFHEVSSDLQARI